MERITETLSIACADEIPDIALLRQTPKEKVLHLHFASEAEKYREEFGLELKAQLDEFVVGLPSADPVIRIARLISLEEINRHQDFFEHCAKEYRKLATELIFALAEQLNVAMTENNPLVAFSPFKCNRKRKGKMGKWQYCFHGFHCAFENKKTEQNIEVPLAYGFDFGDLDPYFFSGFIKSTPAWQPLPVAIYDDYHDGSRIIQQLLALGKLEKIASPIPQYTGVAAVDRSNVDIVSFRSTLESRLHRCKLRWLLKRVKIHTGAKR
ncbi:MULTISPECIES: DUF6896 domain-containing protein [Escherichia]|uniref:DUF6896 domain-containing protein n=1 Tax=Escherichia whittamii TaxID=2762229 RepID=A0ABR8TF77_9ESCH|nr:MULTISPECIES: hypothetical protein [Escherichia]EEZ4382054.1 hypothetical protein [Escherichia coli]MBD7973964.1 hypothetical protein [Escherichia whittamii]MCA4890098.1 hypothetical protein [Escherichia whittamii]MEB7937867.1 hypothetical protein [Escherichia whittamii]MEC9495165.1 hypothetical protein [Escherichia whittamii]